MLGWGRLTYWSADRQAIALALKYEIHSTGFRFTRLDGSAQRNQAQSLAEIFNLLAESASGAGAYQGSVILSALPASPYDAFYGPTPAGTVPVGPELTVTVAENQLELAIATPASLRETPFAASPRQTTYFKDLNLTITQTAGRDDISVAGGVVAVVLGESIELIATLNGDRHLMFTQADPSAPVTVPIQGWGVMDITSLVVWPVVPDMTGLQTQYTFEEGVGNRVYDSAASNAPIDLTVETTMPATAEWKPGHLTLNGGALLSSGAPAGSGARSGQLSSASRLIAACTATEELTIAAWIKPAQASQSGPARIVALSKDPGDRHFMLGQGRRSTDFPSGGRGSNPDDSDSSQLPANAPQYRARIKTTEHRKGDSAFYSELGTTTPEITYVVYTHRKDDRSTPNARFYINGTLNVVDRIGGSLRVPLWEDKPDYKLVMGNVASFPSDDRSWRGELHRVALYNRALSAEEVYRHYYPTLEAAGYLRLHNGPTPLDAPLPATLTLEQGGNNTLQLTVRDQTHHTVTPQFQFTSVDGVWQQTLTDDPADEAEFAFVSGQINSLLWGNAIAFTLSARSIGQEGRFVLRTAAGSNLNLQLEGLSTLTFSSITVESLDPAGMTVPWQIQSTTAMTEVLLPRLRDGRPFDWTVDFKLLSPALGIADGKAVLKGLWLDQPLALFGWQRDSQFLMQGDSAFSLPFQITLGPIFEPGTSHRLIDRVAIASVMQTTLTLELSKLGFLARISGAFEWTDATGTVHPFAVPTFTLSRPPLTPNQVLEEVLERLTLQADAIFAEQFYHGVDYYFTKVEDSAVLYLGDRTSAWTQKQVMRLPSLFSTNAAENSVTVGAFALTQNPDASCTLTLTPAGSSVNDLVSLEEDYRGILTQLEQNNRLIPGVLTLVSIRIAERMPLRLNRILYHYYGLDTGQKAVNLHAGMRLRVDYQTYQFVHPALSTATSGFGGSGTSYYYLSYDSIGSSARINFDAFLAQIQPYVTTNIAKDGAGGSLDTFRSGYSKPYLRLVYPSEAAPIAGSLATEQATTLICADSLTKLDGATAEFLRDGTTSSASTFYFRGRATVIPEISVFMQGQPHFIAVGTTLRQLIEHSVSLSPALLGSSLWHSTGKPRISRLVHEGAFNEPSYRSIKLDADTSVLDLPLVKGDRIVL